MANVRMPDGTVIRGVPDGVSKDDLNAHLVQKYGQERFNKMSGATKAALSPERAAEPSPEGGSTSEFGERVLDTVDKPTPPLSPSIEEASAGPNRDAYVSKFGTHDQQAARLRDESGEAAKKNQFQTDRDVLAMEYLDKGPALTSSGAGGGFLGLPSKKDRRERAAEHGQVIERMVSLGIEDASTYGLTEQQVDTVMTDLTKIEMDRRKAQDEKIEADREEMSKTQSGRRALAIADRKAAAEADDGTEKSYWLAAKKKFGHVIEEFDRKGEVLEATERAKDKQYETLGAMYLDAVSRQSPTAADAANEVIEEVAGQYGMPGELYIRTLATQLDVMFEEEQMTIDGVHAFQKELLENLPESEWEGNKLKWLAGGLIENSNSIAYMAAGLATRSPAVLAVLMGSDVYQQKFTDARADGRSQGEALQDATYSAIIELATEGIPLGRVLDAAKIGGKSRAAKLLQGIAIEGGQEMAVEALQIGYDVLAIDKETSVGEAFLQIAQSGILGAVMGGGMSAPSVIMGDNQMNNLNKDISKAKDALQSVALQIQNPDLKVNREDIQSAKQAYADAVKAKGDLILKRKEAEAEKKSEKGKAREAKRKAKLTPVEVTREAAQEAAEKADQTVKGPITNDDIIMADTLEKAGKAELEEGDVAAMERALDAGYLRITKAGTPVVLPAGQRRIEAVRAAQQGQTEGQADEVIEPTPFTSAKKKAEQATIDEEIGRRMRGEEVPQVIEPKPFTSQQRRKAELTEKVDSKVKDTKVREKIADAIIQAEEVEQAYSERNAAEAQRIVEQRDADYTAALEQQTDVELDVAANLAILDEKGVSGYTGTRLGKVLRNAMNIIEKEEAKATAELKRKFANMSEQGTLFDVTGVLVKGTAAYASAVKVGALKMTKHGLNYSAWGADMVGQFGESIKPVLARIFHDAKKKVGDIMRLSHEKFTSGERKGELKFSPKQYAKPGQMRRLRDILRKLAKEGAEGRLWYEKSGAEILKITGGNKAQARKLAGLFAIYSSGTAVSANTTNALKMWAQFYGTGKLVKPKQGTMAGRFSEQDRTAIAWLESNADDQHFVESFGNKRFPFFVNIMRAIDPKNYDTEQGVTVDLWMQRALGYDQDAPTDAQYAFASSEIMQIAKEMGWENQQAQAAIWVAIKARWEFIQKVAKQKAVDQGLAEWSVGAKGAPLFEVVGASREEQIENEKKIIHVFREAALKVSTAELTKKLAESKADFADNLARHYATISWEAEPSTKLGTNLNALSLADKILLQTEVAALLTNPKTGREFLAEWLELLGADQTIGPGSWDMNVGSVVQNSVIVPVKHKPKGAQSQPEAAQAMDGYAAILGYLLQQDAVAWHKPFYASTKKAANGVEILTSKLSYAKTLRFYEEIVNLTGDPGLAPIVMGDSVRVLNFSEMSNPDFHKVIAEAADRAKVSGDIEVFQSDGNMMENDWLTNKKGESYVESINQNKNPRVQDAFERAKRKFAKPLAEIYAKYSSEEANARVSVTKLGSGTKLKRLPKGHLRFRHFGKADVPVLQVDKAGTGIKGAEAKRGSMKVISAYPNKGFAKEAGLGNNEYVIDVPKTKIYDVNADPLNLMDQAQEPSGSFKMVDGKQVPTSYTTNFNKLEQLIKDAGFAGYYTPKAEGNLKGQARFFYNLAVSDSQTTAKDIPTEIDSTFAISDRPRVTVVENEFDEYEVREKNGEVYYASDPDDAINTARSIHGVDATVVIVDDNGDVITTDVAKAKKPAPIKLEGFAGTEEGDVASVSEFLDEWFELTEHNPLSPDERIIGQAAVTLRPQAGQLWLDSLRSFSKGEGHGSKAMAEVIELADAHGVVLRLTAKPFDTGGGEMDFNTLVNWYERNGFVKTRITEDYSPSAEMVRHPRSVTSTFSWKRPKTQTNEGYGIDRATAKSFIDKHFGRYYGLANFEIVDGVEQLPDELYGQIVYFGYGAKVKGAYHDSPVKGPTIYIVTNNLYVDDFSSPRYGEPDVDGLIELVLHETIGHFGLQSLLGTSYDKTMDAVRRAFPKEVAMRGKDLSKNVSGRRLAAEEFIAYTAEELLNGRELKANQLNVLERVINAIKIAMANMGLRKMTHDDIANLILRSATYVKNTSEAQLKKRARIVTKMKEAQRVIERAAQREVDWTDPDLDVTLSLGMKQARKDDPALDRFMNKIGHGSSNRLASLSDWWELRKLNWKREFEIAMLDQFAGIKHMERELGILGPESGYMSVRLTAGTDVIIRSAIENAVPTWHKDGSVTMDVDSEGLLQVLAPVSQSAEMLKAFEAFVVARRARTLGKQERERLFSREEIGSAFKFIRQKKLHKLFNETAKDLSGYKKKILDFAQEAGLIDPESRKLWERNDHIPFYRVLSDANKRGPFSGSSIGKVGKVVHRLKGGTDPLRHPLESIVQNMSMLIEAAVKNQATATVVDNFMGTGVVTKAPQAVMDTALVPLSQIKDMLHENGVALDAVGEELLSGIQKLSSLTAPTAENVISVQENGKKQYYFVHDAGVMRGLDNVSPTQWIALMKVLRFPKRFITRSITLMPDFILKNWFRDIFHTYMLNRHATVIPVLDSGIGWAKAIAHDETYKDIISGGGIFDSGYVNASDPEKSNMKIRKGLLGKGRHNILDTPRKLGQFYMRIANGAENAHRIMVYQKTLKATGSRKQALFESRDLMDFSMRGANPVVRFLTETVPFWGARVQGISRTGKGFTEDPGLTLMRATPIILASMALYAYNRDDDRYKGLNNYEKRMYYHFYDVFEPGDHFRLPKPFEVGAMFSTIPEIFTEYMLSQEPDRGEAAALAIWWTVKEQLNLMPEVQAVKPAYELAVNENSFTEAPIVSEWEKQLDVRDQRSPRTNKSLAWVADQMPDSAPEFLKSPKQLEHLARGYIGAGLDYALAASGYMFDKRLNDGVDAPSLRWDETPFFKSFVREPHGKYDIYLDSMYDVLAEADKIHNSINLAKKQPASMSRNERIATLREENKALLYARGPMDKAASRVSDINKQIRKVYADRNLTPDEKREKVDALYEKRSEAAKKVYGYRPGGKLNKYEGKDEDHTSYIERLFNQIEDKPKDEQVDALIGAQLPHTATLFNDINISEEKLRSLV